MRPTAPAPHRGAMTFLLLLQWTGVALGAVGGATLVLGAIALPFVDDFVAGHSLATFAELTELVSRA